MSRQTSSTYIYRACVQPHTRALGERRSREKGNASTVPGFLGIGKPRRRVGVSLPASLVTWWSVSQARSHTTNLSSRGEAEDVFIPRACPRHIACLHLSCSLPRAPDDPPPPSFSRGLGLPAGHNSVVLWRACGRCTGKRKQERAASCEPYHGLQR